MCYSLWYNAPTMLPASASAPEDGRNHRPKHVELIGIINKPLLLHLVGVYIIYINGAHSNKYQNYYVPSDFARFQASAAKWMRTVFFWIITQHRVVIPYRRFGTTCRSYLQRSRIQVRFLTVEDGSDRSTLLCATRLVKFTFLSELLFYLKYSLACFQNKKSTEFTPL